MGGLLGGEEGDKGYVDPLKNDWGALLPPPPPPPPPPPLPTPMPKELSRRSSSQSIFLKWRKPATIVSVLKTINRESLGRPGVNVIG